MRQALMEHIAVYVAIETQTKKSVSVNGVTFRRLDSHPDYIMASKDGVDLISAHWSSVIDAIAEIVERGDMVTPAWLDREQ